MERQDAGLAPLLQYENIAWYQPGEVVITDRRVWPYEKKVVHCPTHQSVAQAITDMVTQSGGPYLALGMGMALAAEEAARRPRGEQKTHLMEAAHTLTNARPTTAQRMGQLAQSSLRAALRAFDEGENMAQAVAQEAIDAINRRYAAVHRMAGYLVSTFKPESTVMTMCFAETIVGMMLLELKAQKKSARFICPETRPYLQGARLTASVITDMGFPCHVITDNMPAWIMGREGVDVFTTAADVITMDGHVINKVGTFGIALAAQHYGIPYWVTGAPDRAYPTAQGLPIEEREVQKVHEHLGRRVTPEAAGAYYPAFDVTPPSLVGGVVTPKGIYSPWALSSYYEAQEAGEVIV
ncbi:Methylthioribose-1-phosphate isomerase [Clostridiaceae bacterium JG1575]|nr:Methylthioribose-1-phosphate isomerase [Clostridiaceae bacterium JG1575]